MKRSGVAIGTAVFAAAIGIEAVVEAEIDGIVATENALRVIAQESGLERTRVVIDPRVFIDFEMKCFEAIDGIVISAASFGSHGEGKCLPRRRRMGPLAVEGSTR